MMHPAKEGLIDALAQSAFTIMAVLSKVAAESDLSLTQLRALAILRDRKLGATALADYLGLEKSTMSGLVERAEKRGLLAKSRDESDGRAVVITLSASGKKLAAKVEAQVAAALAPLTHALSAGEQHRLQALLEQMLAKVTLGTQA